MKHLSTGLFCVALLVLAGCTREAASPRSGPQASSAGEHAALRETTFAAEAKEPAAPENEVEANRVIEIVLHSQKTYDNPFMDCEFDAVITRPDGSEVRFPGFWDGDDRWCFRYSSDQTGEHQWRTECTDASDEGLQGAEGTIEVVATTGDNPLYLHGQLRIADDHRHFEHLDGTPFFWLGDTWWKDLCKRMTWEGFQELAADRAAKGFTVVQIVCGPVPDEPVFQESWANEGGMPYFTREFTEINPEFFQYADRRLGHLVDSGIAPAIVGSWARADCNGLAMAGPEGMKRHWRYLIARYGAYPTIWVVSGESLEPEWIEIARYIQQTDPYERPLSTHPSFAMRHDTLDDPSLNFEMLGAPHGDWEGSLKAPGILRASYVQEPAMPVLISETSYEQHMQEGFADQQRYLFWTSILSGAAGHTYGAAGVWNGGVEGDPGLQNVYDLTTWRQGMNFEGSTQLGLGKQFLTQYPWQRFEPHPEWTEEGSFAAGIPSEVRFIYMPKRGIYNWQGARVSRIEPDTAYRVFYFDPIAGRRIDRGVVYNASANDAFQGHQGPLVFADDFEDDDSSAWTDHGAATKRAAGRLVAPKDTVTTYNDFNEADAMASVSAKSDAEAGIILRFHDYDNYLVGFYSPQTQSIFFHDRRDGNWGFPLGEVKVPEIGPEIQLTVAADGQFAGLMLTDGEHEFRTPLIRVENTEPGQVGLWLFQIGETQSFDNFQLSRTPLVSEELANLPELAFLSTDGTLDVSPAPSPQDWVLVLERVEH